MFKKQLLPIIAVLLISVLFGCVKLRDASTSDNPASKDLSLSSSVSPSTADLPQQQVNLGSADNFAILSKSGVTDVYPSSVLGAVGSSPITGAAILLECNEVTGNIYSVDAAGPACKITAASKLTAAVGDMETAYKDAAGRLNPDYSELGAGSIGGKTLTPGLYNWSSSLLIPADIYIDGKPTDVWIFQVAGTLDLSSAVQIHLKGGALPKNIFWQVAGAVSLNTTSHFEGNILGATSISLYTGATINGRLLAQTAVTLQMNTVKMP